VAWPEAGEKLPKEKGAGGGLGESKITGFTDADGKMVISDSAKVRPEGARSVPAAEFRELLNSRATGVLEAAGHTKYFQKQTRRMLADKVKIKFGDRFKAFKEKLAEKLKGKAADEVTPDEKANASAEAMAEVDTSAVSAEAKMNGALEDSSESAKKDLARGIDAPNIKDVKTDTLKPKWAQSETRKKLAKGSGAYAEFSQVVFLVTMGCIVKDVSQSINQALTTRIEAPMILAANIAGEAEQLRSNDGVSMDFVKQRNADYDNVEQSAAMRRISGDAEADIPDEAKLSAADLPFTFFGFSLSSIASLSSFVNDAINLYVTGGLSAIPFINDLADDAIGFVCSKVLDPKVQLVGMVADIIATIASLGTAKTLAAGIVQGIKTVVQVAATVGLTKIVFEYFLPKLLFGLAGSGGVMSAGDPNNGNKADLGFTLLSSQYGAMAGGTTITGAQAQADQEEAMALVRKHEVDQDGAWAYVNPENPYSLTSQFALSLPGDPMKIPGALISKSFSFLFSKSTFSSLANIISPKAKAAGEGVFFETYGVPQTGISTQFIDANPVENALIVDSQDGKTLSELKTKYEHCFTSSLSERVLSDSSLSSSKDFSICGDEMAQRLGLYNIDNCSTTLLTNDVTANSCSIFNGAGDVVAGEGESGVSAIGNTGTVGGASDGKLPNYADTSPCPSDPDIQPAGSGSAQRDGKTVNFTLCKVMNKATVNVVYARNFLNLFKGAQAAGLDLNGGGGSYLSYDAAVARWRERCGSRPISAGYAAPPCTGAKIAPPGKSNHELGLAVDLTCPGTTNSLGGHTTSRAAFNRSDPCVAWVIQNSPSMGLYLQCEGTKGSYCESWHISPTGG
jgi:hypothetical protein